MRREEKRDAMLAAATELQNLLDAENVPSSLSAPERPMFAGKYDERGVWVDRVSMPLVFRDEDQNLHEAIVTFTYSRLL